MGATIDALKPLAEAETAVEQAPQIGVVCYNTLLNLQRPATAPELRLLIAPFVDLRRFKNPLAVIHMALKRMDYVQHFKGTDGKAYFQAVPPTPPLRV